MKDKSDLQKKILDWLSDGNDNVLLEPLLSGAATRRKVKNTLDGLKRESRSPRNRARGMIEKWRNDPLDENLRYLLSGAATKSTVVREFRTEDFVSGVKRRPVRTVWSCNTFRNNSDNSESFSTEHFSVDEIKGSNVRRSTKTRHRSVRSKIGKGSGLEGGAGGPGQYEPDTQNDDDDDDDDNGGDDDDEESETEISFQLYQDGRLRTKPFDD